MSTTTTVPPNCHSQSDVHPLISFENCCSSWLAHWMNTCLFSQNFHFGTGTYVFWAFQECLQKMNVAHEIFSTWQLLWSPSSYHQLRTPSHHYLLQKYSESLPQSLFLSQFPIRLVALWVVANSQCTTWFWTLGPGMPDYRDLGISPLPSWVMNQISMHCWLASMRKQLPIRVECQ